MVLLQTSLFRTDSLPAAATVYVRATVSDPFGHADINNDSLVEILDGTGTHVLAGPFPQTAILSASGSTKEFQYTVTLPGSLGHGSYLMRVRANEGTEGTITHYNVAPFNITANPALLVNKEAASPSTPGTPLTHVSPGDEILYTLQITNPDTGDIGDASDVVILDNLPPFTAFRLGSLTLADGVTGYGNSSLTLGTVEYSSDNGMSWNYTPVSGGGDAPTGFDRNVTHWRVTMQGLMPADSGFRLTYRLRVD